MTDKTLYDGDKIPSKGPIYTCPYCKTHISDMDLNDLETEGPEGPSTWETVDCPCGAVWTNYYTFTEAKVDRHGYCTEDHRCPECCAAEAEHRNDTREDR